MSNSNFLSPVEFRLVVKRLPETSFYLQGVNIPGFNSTEISYPTPLKNVPIPGTRLSYDDLNMTIIVDEDMKSFQEIGNWLIGLSFPEDTNQYKNLKESEDGLYSDLTVFVMDSNKNANIKVTFKKAFPISISGIQLNTAVSDVTHPTFDVTFKYQSYSIEV